MDNFSGEPSTLSVGSKVELTIEDIAFGGDGVGRVGQLVVFVPFVIGEEKVLVEITEIKKNYARARVVEILKPSPERITPECKYFGQCGGCQYQHIAYKEQLIIKQKQVIDILKRIGGFENPPVLAVAGCPRPYGYRNRIMVRSQWNKKEQRLVLGFLGVDNKFVVDIEECKIAEPQINEQLKFARTNPPPRGGLKVTLRIMPEGWELPRDSFFQNNFYALPLLIDAVVKCIENSQTRYLIDAYCGVGFFGIELASRVEKFVGIDVDVMAIKAAKKNAEKRGIRNGEFISAGVERLMSELLRSFPPEKTVVIMDPPRVGCLPGAFEPIRAFMPQQVIYVSCNPATLARDLKILCADGKYQLCNVYPVDMFPQTQHIECVADLRRNAQAN